ncbi:MAG: hypothetical protein CMN30_27715 [Sandaracinus sp.]|nr:hypothetical protein [Sandaracinus sp.]
MQRVETYDSAMASWVAGQRSTAGHWANIANRLITSLGDVDVTDLSTAERVSLLKLAGDRLNAMKTAEESRPVVLQGLTLDHIKSRLTDDEYPLFQAMLRKLK